MLAIFEWSCWGGGTELRDQWDFESPMEDLLCLLRALVVSLLSWTSSRRTVKYPWLGYLFWGRLRWSLRMYEVTCLTDISEILEVRVSSELSIRASLGADNLIKLFPEQSYQHNKQSEIFPAKGHEVTQAATILNEIKCRRSQVKTSLLALAVNELEWLGKI